jgi:hypothetical protein
MLRQCAWGPIELCVIQKYELEFRNLYSHFRYCTRKQLFVKETISADANNKPQIGSAAAGQRKLKFFPLVINFEKKR